MKVILLESVNNLGLVGDVINVKPGYARNYLFPHSVAVEANARNLKSRSHHQMLLEHKLKKARERSEELQKSVEKKVITITKKSAEKDKFFGSVTSMDIEVELRNLGISVSRKAIGLEEPIKKPGKYKVPLKLEAGLTAQISVEVKVESD